MENVRNIRCNDFYFSYKTKKIKTGCGGVHRTIVPTCNDKERETLTTLPIAPNSEFFPVFMLRQRKIKFNMIRIWFLIQYAFLDSLKYRIKSWQNLRATGLGDPLSSHCFGFLTTVNDHG